MSGLSPGGSHALSSSSFVTGSYVVTFDRHIDNCGIVATIGADGTLSGESGPFAQLIFQRVLDASSGFTTSQLLVQTRNVSDLSGGTSAANSGFHVVALCPGT